MVTERKLLLADDSVTIQKVVSLTFTDEGLDVTAVSDGEQAIKKLEEIAPDIVLADVFMPKMNGYEVCERIKRDERFRHIPVLLLVGTFEPFDKAEARRVGADDVLTKPFQSIRELVSKVGSLLTGRSDQKTIGLNLQPEPNQEGTSQNLSPAQAVSPPTVEGSRAEADEQSRIPATTFPWDKPGETASSDLPGVQATSETQTATDAFADFGMDDQMIDATPAENFGIHHQQHVAASPAHTDADLDETPTLIAHTDTLREADTEQKIAPHEDESEDETLEAEPLVTSEEEKQEDLPLAQPAFATHMASAAAADNALTELGGIRSSSAATSEADDFILDLAYEPSVRQRVLAGVAGAGGRSTFPVTDEDSPLDIGFDVEPEQVEDEQYAEAAVAAEADSQILTIPVPSYQAELIAPQARGAGLEVGAGRDREAATREDALLVRDQQISLEQLSPEVIDAIARRMVEQLSERVVQEIAWEVVPELAERLIKRRLEEERSRAQ